MEAQDKNDQSRLRRLVRSPLAARLRVLKLDYPLPPATFKTLLTAESLSGLTWLEVDGGIDMETLPKMKEAGATAFVAATAVFKHPEGPAAGVKSLCALLG